MVDNAQTVKVEAELDASQTVRGARDASQELVKLLGDVQKLEKATRDLFTGNTGQLPQQLQALSGMLQTVQQLPAQMAEIQRLSRRLSTGGPATAINQAALQGVRNTIRNDPVLQQLAVEKDLNKVLEGRGEIYRRLRDAMPDNASAMRLNQVYRTALASIGDIPEKGTKAYAEWLDRTKIEVRRFEQDRTKIAEAEALKRGREQLRIAKQTNSEEMALARAHAAELNRLFRRDMAGVMTAGTPEARRAAAGESVNRIRDYAGRRGLTGFNEDALLNQYEDAEARRSARDLTRRPPNAPMSDEERAGRSYQQRDAFMNYNGGANRIGSRFQFAGDFAAVGAVMGTAMYAGRSTVELEKQLKQLQAITKSTDSEMQSLQGTIFGVGQSTNFMVTEIAEAATVMGQAGYSASQIKDALPAISNLATAAGGDLSNTVATVTSVLSIYDMSIDRTANISNMLAEALNGSKLSFEQLSLGLQYAGNVAADGGVQFEELTAALGAMSNAGIRSGSTLGTGFRALIQELENPSDKFLEWLKSVGLTADDVDVRTQGLSGALQNLTAKSFDSGTAMNVFEIRAASAFSALSNNLDVLDQLQDDMNNTNAATEGAKTQMESLAAQSTRLGNSVTEFTTVAGAPLMAFFQGLIGALASTVSAMAGMGPIIQIIATGIGMLIAVNLIKWLGTLLIGFTGLRTAMAASHVQAMILQASAGNMGLAFGAATAGVRAFTLALIASPVGLFVLGLTAVTTAFTLQQSAAANTAKQLDAFKTKANEAAAESQKFGDRIDEINGFMETLINRAGSMANETVYAGQMAEAASAKFAGWGLVLEGNISTVNQLVAALAGLSREQAQAALSQKQLELAALQGQKGVLDDTNIVGRIKNRAGSFEELAGRGTADALITPQFRALLASARAGTLNQTQTNALVGQLSNLRPKLNAGVTRDQLDRFLEDLRGANGLAEGFKIDAEIKAKQREIGDLTVAGSSQNEAAVIRGTQEQLRLRERQREIEDITDPATRARARAGLNDDMRARVAYNNEFRRNLAQQAMRDPNVEAAYAERSRISGIPIDQLIANQLGGKEGFGAVNLAGGNLDAMNSVQALRSRERALTTQIQEAGTESDPARRDAMRRSAEAERLAIRRRIVAMSDEDPAAMRSMLDDVDATGGSASSVTQQTSEQRAARDRAKSLKLDVKRLQERIEATAINTVGVATTSGGTGSGSAAEMQAMQFLMAKGLTQAQAAGIVGNLGHESAGMNTRALGDNGSAYGLAQWRGDRRSALSGFAADRGTGMDDFTTQMEFLWKEMGERGDLGAIQGATTAAEAAEIFARKFERPRGAAGPLGEMAGWSDRLGRSNRLMGTPTTTMSAPDNTAIQALLDEWKASNVAMIRAEGAASNISDDELNERLADFEVVAQEYFNDVLSGNASKMKQLLADASLRAADGFAAQTSAELREGGDLAQSLADINTVYLAAAQAAMDASDAEFRAKGSDVDPAIAGEAVERRRAIQQEFAGKVVTSTLDAIDQFFAGEAARAATEVERLNLEIERERARIATLSNAYGSRRLSDVQRYLGGMESERLDARQSGVDLQSAQTNSRLANEQVSTLEARKAVTSDPLARLEIESKLVTARENAEAMAIALERAQYAFSAMNDEAPEFASFGEALSGAWTAFTDQMENSKGTWETVADGLLDTLNVAKGAFSTMVVDVVSGNKTMGAAFKDFTLSILQSLLDLAAEMLAKKIIMWAIQVIGGQFGGGPGMDAQGSSMLSGGPGAYTSGNYLNGGMGMWHGGPVRMSSGGPSPDRDSVPILGMPGEVMMSKSAVDMVGRDTLLALNGRANSRLSAMPQMPNAAAPREPDTVNVWVVKEEAKPPMGKRDVLVAVHEDIMTGGVTKQLIKAVAVGGA